MLISEFSEEDLAFYGQELEMQARLSAHLSNVSLKEGRALRVRGSERAAWPLGQQRLSPAATVALSQPRGIVRGQHRRIFLPLVVSSREQAINVLFVVSTGSPYTYLRRDTWEQLGLRGSVVLHGLPMPVHASHGGFENVDLLGQDCLAKLGHELRVNYEATTATLEPLPPLL